MCITFVHVGEADSPYAYVLGLNRDEFFERPSTTMHEWIEQGEPNVFAGRDLRAGGTWMGIRAKELPGSVEQAVKGPMPKPAQAGVSFRLGLITNYREKEGRDAAATRGEIVAKFLSKRNESGPEAFAKQVAERGDGYRGFNLLVADAKAMYFVSNRPQDGGAPERLAPGYYGMSNGPLQAWPKVVEGRRRFQEVVEHHLVCGGRDAVTGEGLLVDRIFDVLADDTPRGNLSDYPGVHAPDVERALSSIKVSPFLIKGHSYGTRSSYVLVARRNGTVSLWERACLDGAQEMTFAARHKLIFKPDDL